MFLCRGGNRGGTFKPKKPKNIAKGAKGYDLHKHAKATLGSGNLKAAVQLPAEEDLNEWLAVNSLSLLFSLVSAAF